MNKNKSSALKTILQIIISLCLTVFAATMIAVVCYILLLAFLFPHTKEISRSTSPDGKVNTVLYYTTGGAVGPHYNSLYLEPSQKRWCFDSSQKRENLVCTIEKGMPHIIWSGNECLIIEYENCDFNNVKKSVTCCGNHIEIKLIDVRDK
ncbi:MAG: hypothetical protein AB2L14_01220 [Candidatus Xenobiia bacterium LiM19]